MRNNLLLLPTKAYPYITIRLAIPPQGFCRSDGGALGNEFMLIVAGSL